MGRPALRFRSPKCDDSRMLRRLAAVGLLLVAALLLARTAHATTFYVSPAGSDAASGGITSPWRTVARVNNSSLAAGDVVLFAGGATFADATLMPPRAGSSGLPIVFGSYGIGQATLGKGIWLDGTSYLTFDALTVDASGASGSAGIASAAGGSGTSFVTVTNCRLQNLELGINMANRGDGGWRVENTLIQHTGDSGVLTVGHDSTFTGNSILDTGENTSITYGKHGVYAKGPGLTFVGNTIRRFSADGLSLRYRNAVARGNTISDGGIGIGWFQQDASAGSSTIAYNTISNTRSSGIYVSPSDDAGATRESFVIASNTIVGSGGNGVDLNTTSGSLTLANNSIGGAISPAAHIASPGGAYSEHHNDFSSTAGTAQLNFNGSVWGLAAYRTASGQGSGDLSVAPLLGTGFMPGSTSPLIDAGSTSVTSLGYTASCDGAAFHFCGSAPEIGAVETSTTAPTPTPLALTPPTALTASATATSVTLSWTAAADSRVTAYSLTKDGSAAGTFSGTTATVSGLACGTTSSYALRSVATDGTLSDPASLQVATTACATPPPPPPPPPPTNDTTLPWVMITSPLKSQTVPLLTTVKVDATDASGIADVTFWVDSTIVCVDKVAPYSCAVTLKSGTRTLLVRATDGAGNAGWMSIKVTASSKLAPTTTTTGSLAPSQGAAVQSRFTLALRAPAPQVKTVTFMLDGRHVCTDRRRPFACAVSAAIGWHRAITKPAGMLALSTRFRVR
jgi:hypothetical protein